MSQKQYLKMIEKELNKVNKLIDQKIMRGEDYHKEAKDHRLMLRRMRYLQRGSFFKSLASKFSVGFTLF